MMQAAVVLAAGQGTRMKSDLAKVLHPVAGRPMIEHVLGALQAIDTDRTVVIVGHQADSVRRICEAFRVESALQEQQLGTGHAVDQARLALEGLEGFTLILCGDVPLLASETLRRLRDETVQSRAAGSVLTAIAEDPTGYGRILRDEHGDVTGIVEHRDASEAQREIREYNTGTYCFRNELLWEALSQVGSENSQGEFYLTDVIGILVRKGQRVLGVICEDEREVQGVNTTEDLARAERDYHALRG